MPLRSSVFKRHWFRSSTGTQLASPESQYLLSDSETTKSPAQLPRRRSVSANILTDEEQLEYWESIKSVGNCWAWKGDPELLREVRSRFYSHRMLSKRQLALPKYERCHASCVNWFHLTGSAKPQLLTGDPPPTPVPPAVRRMLWRN